MKIKENIEIKYSNTQVDYSESLKFMENRVYAINQEKSEELIWFLNHDHIYTIGTSGNKNEIHTANNLPIFETNRGGKVTYHGPGQRIIYFMINLSNRNKDIRKFVSVIEKSIIYLLKDLNIEAQTYPDRIGIWVTKNQNVKLDKEKKIGAIGLRIKKWVTYHGVSFNINTDLKHYDKIYACGLKEYDNTSIKDLNVNLSYEDFDKIFLNYFLKELTKL
tara:strand:- start:170 stop:826 length:657 start_codon:yes stop_codon:yes gene_type:complete